MQKTISESKVGAKKFLFLLYTEGEAALEWTVFTSTKTLSKKPIYLAKLRINGDNYNSYGCFGHTFTVSEDTKSALLAILENKSREYFQTLDKVAVFGEGSYSNYYE